MVVVHALQGQLVSIHAPVRGATAGVHPGELERIVSIHAPVRGATRLHPLRCRQRSSFDPRPCTRGDLGAYVVSPSKSGFDPRPCTRGDGMGAEWTTVELVSIHAPVRGATRVTDGVRQKEHSFDPRPCTRGDNAELEQIRGQRSFDPRPCTRGDIIAIAACSTSRLFRSTPLYEGRPGGSELVD